MESNTKSVIRNTFISTIQTTRKLNFAEKRLIKDLEELEEKIDPTMGISAQPLAGNLMKWHANIQGPEGSPYEGGTIHLEFNFPQDYPNAAPTINQVTKFNSPFFQREKFTTEMVDAEWCSGYSVASLLIQIQCCLFDVNPGHANAVKQQMENTLKFKCPSCSHDTNNNNVWPPFHCILEGGPMTFDKLTEEEKLVEDTYCFHTRLNVKQTLLGTGVAYSRLARTKQINKVYTTIDNVSMKAFNEGLRKSINKKRFTHWIPLFFGEGDQQVEKTLEHFRKCLSLLGTNRSDQFEESLILKIMPYMMLTHALQVIQDKSYSSIKGLRMFLCFHRAFLFLLDQHPNVKNEVETFIKNFVESEEKRTKDYTPDLGVLLTLLSVSEHYSFDLIKQIFIFESLDRKVLWTSKKVPNLLNIETQPLNEARAKESFECNQQSFQLHLFFSFFISQLLEKNEGQKNMGSIKQEYDKRLCRLDPAVEEAFQKQVKDIQNVNSYESYFLRMGFPAMKLDKLNNVLKQAVKNSANKKYHGGVEVSFPLPDPNKRITEIFNEERLFDYGDFVMREDNQMEEQKGHEQDDAVIKYQLIQKYPRVAIAFLVRPDLQPGEVAYLADLHAKTDEDLYLYCLNNQAEIKCDPYINSFRKLIAKLDVQRALYLSIYAPDKEALVTNLVPKIESLGVESLCLSLRCVSKNIELFKRVSSLKSLTLLISRDGQHGSLVLNQLYAYQPQGSLERNFSLTHLELQGIEPKQLVQLDDNMLDFVKAQASSLEKLAIYRMEMNSERVLKLLNAGLKNLREFKIVGCNAAQECAKMLGQIAKNNADHIVTVEMQGNYFSDKTAYLMESLMECKQLRKMNFSNLDLSQVPPAKFEETFSAYADLPFLEDINFSQSQAKITQKALDKLSASKSLISLNLQGITIPASFDEHISTFLFKKGVIKHPLHKLTVNQIGQASKIFAKNMQLEPIEEEKNQSSANLRGYCLNMEGSSYDLQVNGTLTLLNQYNHIKLKNTQNSKSVVTHMLAQGKDLKSLEVSNTVETPFKFAIEKMIFQKDKLEAATFNQMKLGVGEAHALGNTLGSMNKLTQLNLYGNLLGVEGAVFLSNGLKANSSLRVLDIGCNRIRNKGALAIARGVFEEGSLCQIQVLSMKNNFINEKGFKHLYTGIMERCGPLADKSKFYLRALLLGGNQISLFELKQLQRTVQEQKLPLLVDSFDRIKNNTDSCLFLSDVNSHTVQKEKVQNKLQNYIKDIVVKDVTLKKGQKHQKTKANKQNTFMFIEFDHPNGVAQSLKCAKDLLH